MKSQGQYVFDSNTILHNAYYLLCVFFANKEIARRSDESSEKLPLSQLEGRYLESEVSKLLLQLAISLRVFDDQMHKLAQTDSVRIKYYTTRAIVDTYTFGLFDDLNLDLREVCNKIIHSEVLELHKTEGYEAHEFDEAFKQGMGEREINWQHFSGYVRLYGHKGKDEWSVLLDIEVFVRAIQRLFN